MYQRMVRYIMELNPDHELHVFATGRECLDQLKLAPDNEGRRDEVEL